MSSLMLLPSVAKLTCTLMTSQKVKCCLLTVCSSCPGCVRSTGVATTYCVAAARWPSCRQPHPLSFPLASAQAKHRRVRRWDLLWLVRAWAARWCALERRKQARAAAYQAAMERPDLPEPERAALEACLHALLEADSQEVHHKP